MLSFSSILKALGFKTDLLPRRAYWRGSTSITRGQVAALPLILTSRPNSIRQLVDAAAARRRACAPTHVTSSTRFI